MYFDFLQAQFTFVHTNLNLGWMQFYNITPMRRTYFSKCVMRSDEIKFVLTFIDLTEIPKETQQLTVLSFFFGNCPTSVCDHSDSIVCAVFSYIYVQVLVQVLDQIGLSRTLLELETKHPTDSRPRHILISSYTGNLVNRTFH